MPTSHLPQFLVLAIAALAAILQPNHALSMTLEEIQQVDTLTERMNTRCVGRYLIDLPEAFVVNTESRSEVEGVKISATPMREAEFRRTLEATRARLESETIYGKSLPSLTSTIELPDNRGVVFNRSRTRESEVLRTLDLLALKDGMAISMALNARQMKAVRDPKDTRQTDTPEKLAHLLSVYDRVRGRRDDEVPTQPGLCIPNGFVLGAQREEQTVGFVYHLRDSKDVYFTARTDDDIKERDTLLQRIGPQEREMAKDGHLVLRKGKRQIHGDAYEEFLAQGPADDGVLGASFNLHGNELRQQPLQPFFVFRLRTGMRIPRPEMNLNEKDRLGLFKALPHAGLTPEQAVRLWDAVTPTIRHRPGAF